MFSTGSIDDTPFVNLNLECHKLVVRTMTKKSNLSSLIFRCGINSLILPISCRKAPAVQAFNYFWRDYVVTRQRNNITFSRVNTYTSARLPRKIIFPYFFSPTSFNACMQRPLTFASFFSRQLSSLPSPGLMSAQLALRSSLHSLAI